MVQPEKMASIDSLPVIDISTLTQSELRDLSLCSNSVFDLNRLDDVVIPIIDRSQFNESAGSRRQTFSRPATTTHHHHHHHPIRHRIPGLLPSNKHTVSSLPPHLDPEHIENRSILNFLKQSLCQSPEFNDVVSLFSNNLGENGQVLRKRKRGRKPKTKVKSLEENLELVNKNGKVINIVGLGSLEDPFREELRRRTEGMGGNEEALLGLMRDLGGQWCSRRKKRKIVDASLLGDSLPVGWKLLLGLKRREGRASVYCRRYISPGGQHFVCCKEVSGYLQSYFGLHDAHQEIDHGGDNILHEYKPASESHTGVTLQKENDQRQYIEQDKETTLLGIDNLAEVQIHDLFECHKCDMTFGEKDAYLQHLLSFHQRTTRRYRLGSSVGDGVIIKDGKFECQFCHKVFHERRRYNGHVGIHVRNYVRGIEPPDRLRLQNKTVSPTRDRFPTRNDFPVRISKMDALIEIAQNSILERSSSRPNGEPDDGSATDKLNLVSNLDLRASASDHELTSDSDFTEPAVDVGMIDSNLGQQSYQQNNELMVMDEKMETIDDASNLTDVKIDSCVDPTAVLPADERNDYTSEASGEKDGLVFITDEIDKSGIELESASKIHSHGPSSNQKVCPLETNVNLVCTNKVEHGEPDEMNDNKTIELVAGLQSNNMGLANDKIPVTAAQNLKENLPPYGISECSISLLEPSHDFRTPNARPIKEVDDKPFRVDQRHNTVTGFEELRLDEIGHLKYSAGSEHAQESISVSEVPVEIANNLGTEGSYSSSILFESAEVMLSGIGNHNNLTNCVWCGMEFSHDEAVASDMQIQSDSVGYMCPTCKTKISGNVDVLGTG